MNGAFPIDQSARDRFSFDLDRNFALICPAGSGKTRGISSRILSIAQQPNALDLLPRLVVVTFTNASANEMHSRAREALLQAKVPWGVQRAFDFAFFGTIHSFANRLLREHGHHIGLPPVFEVSADADSVWGRFVRRINANSLASGHHILRHYPIQRLLNLVRVWDEMRQPGPKVAVPEVDFSSIYEFELPKRADTARSIADFQDQLRQFESVWNGNSAAEFCELPEATKGGKKFLEVVDACLAPVREWINSEVCHLAYELASEFRTFRAGEGVLLFSDIISMARELLLHETAKVEIRSKGYIVLLDEAQDTDPFQFDFLIESVRPVRADGFWRECPNSGTPEAGRFSLVGDLQQSIYSKQADLGYFQEVVQYLENSAAGERLDFSVTFRCDKAVVGNVETFFSRILNGSDGQVPYVPIKPREGAGDGNVMRLPIPLSESGSTEDACRAEVSALASALLALRKQGKVRRWNEVALICPRKAWFGVLAEGLAEFGISSQFLSFGMKHSDSLAWSFVTAFARAFTCPSDTYETVGLLRDVYGLSDVELFDFCEQNGDRFILNGQRDSDNPVAGVINRLSSLRKACLRGSLLDGVDLIIEEVRPRLKGNRDELLILDRISVLASKAEKSGSDLEMFTETLRDGLSNPLETSGENPNDSVQIITDLKAKGLQWEVVVLPFFFRSIYTVRENYPFLQGNRLSAAAVASRKADISDDEATRVERATVQEFERRLYVSFTRPKHLLLICDDEACFESSNQAYLPNNGKVLRVNESGELRPSWDSIPFFDVRSIQGGSMKPKAPAESSPVISIDLEASRNASHPSVERIRPYRAASEYTSEEREFNKDDVTFINGASGRPSGRTYGVWWHETMRACPWVSRDAAAAYLEESVAKSPDMERAKRECDLLQRSSLFEMLVSGDYHVKSELPFQYSTQDGNSVEGIMDLCLVDVLSEKWVVIDWKTNRSTSMASLMKQYLGQIQAYGDALHSLIPGASIQVGVYSTEIGEHSLAGISPQ